MKSEVELTYVAIANYEITSTVILEGTEAGEH